MISTLCEPGTVTYSSPPSGLRIMRLGALPNCRFASRTRRRRSTAEIWFASVADTKATELSGKTTICSGCCATPTLPSEASVCASNNSSVESSRLATSTTCPSGVTRASHGRRPVRARATICFVVVSMATSMLAPDAATYARFPSGENSTAEGAAPTGMRFVIFPLVASSTQTYPPPLEAPQISFRAASARKLDDPGPVETVATVERRARSTTDTVPSPAFAT